MTNQSTIDKLIEMRLTTMADAFRNQLADPKFREVPFEDRFGMLVDIEYSNRKNNRLKRLIHNAGFDQPEANIIDINYTSGRKLNKDLINCIFRKNCASVPEERSAVPLQTEQSSAGLLVTIIYSAIPARKFKTICLGGHSA